MPTPHHDHQGAPGGGAAAPVALSPREVMETAPPGLSDALAYPFFQSVWDRKSRRVGLGMEIDSGVFTYKSPTRPYRSPSSRRPCSSSRAPASTG